MSNTQFKIAFGTAIAGVALALMAFLFGHGSSAPATQQSAGGTTQTNLDTYAPQNAASTVGPNGTESDAGFFDAAGGASKFLGSLVFGSISSITNGWSFQGTANSCNTGTSTLFSVAPPGNATSTAQIMMTVGGNATTSNLLVGTSTLPSGITASTISPTLANSSNGIPTSTVQSLVGGLTDIPAGFINPGAGSQQTIIVTPGQRVAAFSTTTASGLGATSYSPGFSSCSYKILWNKL